MYLNQVSIIGNLTRDPELKKLPNGTSVANFSVATNRVWYDAQKQKQEAVEYHNIVAFGKQAENIAQYMKKGSSILIQGRLQTQSWEDQATQKKMYRTEIVAENVQFGSKPTGNTATTTTSSGIQYPEATVDYPELDEGDYPDEPINVEDIPF